MSIKLNVYELEDKITLDVPEAKVLISFKTVVEGQIFKEWLEDRGTKQFETYVEEVYGLK